MILIWFIVWLWKGRPEGVWNDTCDICGEEDVPCANAQHDFGIYNDEKERAEDAVQDKI